MDYDKLRPNFSQIPNVILDEWMRELDHIEFKIVMVVARKTYGWHKDRDKIALSQYMEMAGASKNGVKQAIVRLIARGYIRQTVVGGGNIISEYEIAHSKDSDEMQGQAATPKRKARGSSGDPQSIAERPPEPLFEGRPATPQKKSLNKLPKEKVPSALIIEIKSIFEKGYIKITGRKLSWGSKAAMYQKAIVDIALHAIDVRPDKPLEEVRDRAKVLLQRIRQEVQKPGKRFYANMGFTPQTLRVHWNNLTDTSKGMSTDVTPDEIPIEEKLPADCKQFMPYLVFKYREDNIIYYDTTETLSASFVEEKFAKAGFKIRLLNNGKKQIT